MIVCGKRGMSWSKNIRIHSRDQEPVVKKPVVKSLDVVKSIVVESLAVVKSIVVKSLKPIIDAWSWR